MYKPTEISQDLIAALDTYRTMQSRMEEQNQRYSDSVQQQNELEQRMEGAQREIEVLKERCTQLARKEHDDIAELKQSPSWRIGNRIVRIMRMLTFQRGEMA